MKNNSFNKISLIVGAIVFITISPFFLFSQSVVKFETPGEHQFVVPSCVSQITVEVWGGGGGGGGTSSKQTNGCGADCEACTEGGGGGGGGYAKKTYSVSQGQTFTLHVGAGGNGGVGTDNNAAAGNGGIGGTSDFLSTPAISVTGGVGGSGATANNTSGFGHVGDNGEGGTGGVGNNGDENRSGGSGSKGSHSAGCADLSGAGGGAGGPGANGSDAQYINGCPHNNPMNGGNSQGLGGKGANGIKGSINANLDKVNGNNGTAYGGGGSGGSIHLHSWPGSWQKTTGGKGADGAVIITYTSSGPATPTYNVNPATCTASGSVSIANFDAGYNYTVKPSSGSNSNANLSGTPGIQYTLVVDNGLCKDSSTFTIPEQLTPPTTPTVSTTNPSCSNAATATIDSYNSSLTYTVSNGGSHSGANITGLTAGQNYTVTVSNGSCTATSTDFSIQAQPSAPAVPTYTNTPATCTADGAISIANYSGVITYTFNPNTASNSGASITGIPGVQYTLTADNGVCKDSSMFTIPEQLTPPDTPTITIGAASCVGQGTATISNYNSGLTYTIAPSGTHSGASITGITSGTDYTVTASNGSCSATSIAFSIDPMAATLATPTILTTPASCVSQSSANITNYNPSLTYVFSPTSLGINVDSTGTINGLTSNTDYTVNATDGTCTSDASSPFSVQAAVQPPTVSISGAMPICAGESLTLTASSAPSGGTYSWNNGAGNSETAIVTPQNTTTYIVTYSSGGCDVTDTATVVVNPQVSPTFTNPGPICIGSTFTLPSTSNNGIAGTWSPQIDLNQTTEYTFTPNSSQTCTSVVKMTVVVTSQITPAFNNPGAICSGASFSLPTVSNDGINGTWSPAINNEATTTYTFTPASSQSCVTTTTITVVVNPNFTINVIKTDVDCADNPAEAEVKTNGTSSYTYNWSNGSDSAKAVNLEVGDYNIEVIDVNGCKASTDFKIEKNNNFSAEALKIPNVITPNNDGVNDEFELPFLKNDCIDIEMIILNRWGQVVCEMDKTNNIKFEGKKLDGKLLTDGIYFYQVKSKALECDKSENKGKCSGFIHVVTH